MPKKLFLLFATLPLCPAAFALNPRSAVSINGLDTNPCTVASPCRSFGAALSQTQDGGEVIALDSAGYGPFSISQSVTVSGAPGVHAAITVPTSGTGIAISGSSYVLLRNLVVQGGGSANYGIFANGIEVRATNCVLRGFNSAAFYSIGGNVVIEDSTVLDTFVGIFCVGGHMTVSRVLVENYDTGIKVESVANADVLVSDSVITNGTNVGVQALSDIGLAVLDSMVLESCKITHNLVGVSANASGGNNSALVYLSQNVISYNTTGATEVTNGTIYSFGNNRFSRNSSDGAILSPISLR